MFLSDHINLIFVSSLALPSQSSGIMRGGAYQAYIIQALKRNQEKKILFFYLMIIFSNTQTKKTYIHNYLLVWLHMLVLWLMKLCKPYDLSKWTKDLRNVTWHTYNFAFTWKAVMTLDQLLLNTDTPFLGNLLSTRHTCRPWPAWPARCHLPAPFDPATTAPLATTFCARKSLRRTQYRP